VEVKGFFL